MEVNKRASIKSIPYDEFKDNDTLEKIAQELNEGGANVVVGSLDAAINWGRSNSLWSLTFGTSCCGIEFMAVGCARYDFSRFGFEVTRNSPRQADLIMCAGTITNKMAPVFKRLYDEMAEPKYVVAVGGCAISGGPFKKSYNVVRGISELVPVDVYIPGCPPTPAATLYGFAMALGLLEQKIHARGPGELDEQPAEILHGDMVQPLRVKVDREARRLAGYRYGRQIADDYLTQLGQGEEQVARWLEAENDPRLNEIVSHLHHVVEEARIR